MQEPEDQLRSMCRQSPLKEISEWAFEKHKNQKYGTHPYDFHLIGVAANVIELAPLVLEHVPGDRNDNLQTALICAFLHDVIEDGHASPKEVRDYFPREIIDVHTIMVVLDHLTKKDYETYPMYILNRICKSECAITKLVKLADLRFNKYQDQIAMNEGKRHFKHMYDKYSFAEYLVMQSLYRS